jgi:hypothetical protein
LTDTDRAICYPLFNNIWTSKESSDGMCKVCVGNGFGSVNASTKAQTVNNAINAFFQSPFNGDLHSYLGN